jgi:hypothetical protein
MNFEFIIFTKEFLRINIDLKLFLIHFRHLIKY